MDLVCIYRRPLEKATSKDGRDLLLHDLLIVHCISDINVRIIWKICDGRIKIEDIWGCLCLVEMCIEPLDEGRLA